ncbi:hypothetical protein, partial [Methylocystis sp.]|uniref:hypothetical protein n=1 Tax=Methylocystis sp. TaxID=1911079 RepID=UPI0027349F18
PIVSTTSIPHRPLNAKAGRPANSSDGGQFWTPIPQVRGSKLHAETQSASLGEKAQQLDAVLSPISN